ncbi:hypothetical protein [Paenibacillus polymyxa]|uniref:hypothetical protein n=1 Tax=Paenibacillus polymyxa TaxID=1406 RepID=UPI0025B634A7|nr:hypothetical protein [Paenibacillus polymyxa]MDN4106423.1 hypothetical protein [Paenibacillus polymyxa]
MLKAASIIVAGIIIACIETPMLLKNKFIKELWIFSLLLIVGVMLGVLQTLHLPVPNPTEIITVIFKPISNEILSIFK